MDWVGGEGDAILSSPQTTSGLALLADYFFFCSCGIFFSFFLYCGVWSQGYLLLTTLVLETSPETVFRLIQAFNWSKNNFGEINIPQGLDWAFHSLSYYSLLVKVKYFPPFLAASERTLGVRDAESAGNQEHCASVVRRVQNRIRRRATRGDAKKRDKSERKREKGNEHTVVDAWRIANL